MIPDVTRDQILDAMGRFDREQRETPDWATWEERGTYKFAIVHEGRRYPVKELIALATGATRNSFSGGSESNGYLRQRGFAVEPLRAARMPNIWWANQGDSYAEARQGGFIRAPQRTESGSTPLHWRTVGEVRQGDIVVHCESASVRAIGLVEADVAVVPFDLATELKQFEGPRWRAAVLYHDLQQPIPVKEIAEQIVALGIANGPLNYRGTLNQGYLWRFSAAGLRVLREASDEPWPEWAEALLQPEGNQSWVFQSVPDRYDLMGALAELHELPWRVNQHQQDIHMGDTVYLWEAGDGAGIAAVATVLTEPSADLKVIDDQQFVRLDEEGDDARLYVRLRVERVLPQRITKQDLLAHPILNGMRIMKNPRGTNFAVTEEEDAALHLLTTESASPRILKIAPGENAELWERCLADGRIRVGWDGVGDLRKFSSREDFLTSFRVNYPTNGIQTADGLWSLRDLQPGDLIIANKGQSEIIGVGTVVAPGYEWAPDHERAKHSVRVQWDTTRAGTIPRQASWIRTILPVSPEVWMQLSQQIGIAMPPSPPAPEQQPPVSFDDLLRALAEEGLAFAPETVANYLLALQAKRFVILTGISGTGKTQLALAVARAFRPRVRVTRATMIAGGALDIEIKPYMINHKLMVLPVRFVAGLLLPAVDTQTGSGQIAVTYPGGQTMLSFRKDPTRNVTDLFFKGAFRTWFTTTLHPGDHCLLEPVEGGEDQPHGLRFSLPRVETHEEVLDNLVVMAVRPDWTDNRGLLGYYNPLTSDYARTPFLDLLLRARDEAEAAVRADRPARPFFVVLDEMNLARVEHYFSDFLSALESRQSLHLHANEEIAEGETGDATAVPRALAIPDNLFFTGTVNVDETTYMFSPKVLDRAFTIEFNRVDLHTFGTDPDAASGSGDGGGAGAVPAAPPMPTLELPRFPGYLSYDYQPNSSDWDALGALVDGRPRQLVVALHDLLTEEHRHFGYRVANEIARFVTLAAEQAGDDQATVMAALDLAILQKVLPKFHGTQQELESVLTALCDFAIHGQRRAQPDTPAQLAAGWRLDRTGWLMAITPSGTTAPTPVLPRIAAKLWGMLRRLRQQGFASFIE